MKKVTVFRLAVVLALAATTLNAQNASPPGVPVKLVVTHEPQKSELGQILAASDLTVEEAKDRRPVLSLQPAGKQGSLLQLLILIDDSARSSFGTQISTLKQFIEKLPPDVEIGVGYMRNGTNQMVSPFTADHAAAANSVRLPFGAAGADVSPYESLATAIKAWPAERAERREVIMISSGIDGLGGGYTPDNPYVNAGIREAQKGGVIVFPIFNPSVGSGRSFWRGTWGQNFLSQLADETGGEAYNINMGTPVSLEPFLQDIMERLSRQYVLTFDAKAEDKADLQNVKIRLAKGDGSLAHASKVFVRAGQ